MERMGALDAEFLHLEDGITHMHIGSCAVFEGPAPSFDELEALTEAKLETIPRYRKRVRFVPLQLGRPVWADDPQFDVGRHLRRAVLRPPGDDDELRQFVGRVMSQELDREHPLWQNWLVEGLADGRWALVTKVHHSMVDGVAGADLMAAMLDLEPDPPPPEPGQPWSPDPDPSTASLLVGAASHLAETLTTQARALPGAVREPARIVSRAADVARGLATLGSTAQPGPHTSIEGPIGPDRRWTWTTTSLASAKSAGRALGGTVNDVVLATVAGGFRTLLSSRGEDPDTLSLRALIPVSIRTEHGALDNQVSAMVATLPIDVADPVDRMAAVQAEMARLKGSHEAEAGETMIGLGGLAPPAVLAALSRGVVRVLERVPQRTVNTVATNVPGPQFPLYACGREMLSFLPYVPIAPGAPIGVAILSYNGELAFGVTGDADSAPDLDVLCEGIEASLVDLRAAS